MRLQKFEIDSIKSITKDIFGENSKVILFGSRVDDAQKGGDIDLYIKPEKKENLSEKKIDFLVELKSVIGDQKIDVVIAKDRSRLREELDIAERVEWLKLREIGNEIAHEYSFNTDEVVENINSVYDSSNELINIYKKAYDFCAKRFDFLKLDRNKTDKKENR